MLDWCCKHFKLLEASDSNVDVGYLVPTERGPRFCSTIEGNRVGAIVPKARWVYVGRGRNRVGLLSPEEFWSCQQISLADFMHGPQDFETCLERFSYASLMKFAGNAFHSSSAGVFIISCLLLERFKDYGIPIAPGSDGRAEIDALDSVSDAF
jgi:hypothetical protein